MKFILKKVVFGIFGVIFAFILAIILVELFFKVASLIFPASDTYRQGLNPLRFMEYDSVLLWKIRPNVSINIQLVDGDIFNVKTTDLGFDDIGFRDDGINGSVYAIVLGDSFTFGAVNLTDTWVEQLESKSGKDFINMGVSGYSTMQSETLLKDYGIKLVPKLVLIQFFYNDIEGNQLLTSKSRWIRNWLSWNTKLYGTIRYYKYQIFDSPTSTSISYNDEKINFTFQPKLFPHKETVESSVIQEGILKTEESFTQIKELSDSIDAKMVIVIMPSKEQIYGYLVSDKISDFDKINLDYYTDVVEQICKEKELICFNLVPMFRENAKNTQLFYPSDSHFNIYGNELAAEGIYKFLQKEGLLNLKTNSK